MIVLKKNKFIVRVFVCLAAIETSFLETISVVWVFIYQDLLKFRTNLNKFESQRKETKRIYIGQSLKVSGFFSLQNTIRG